MHLKTTMKIVQPLFTSEKCFINEQQNEISTSEINKTRKLIFFRQHLTSYEYVYPYKFFKVVCKCITKEILCKFMHNGLHVEF